MESLGRLSVDVPPVLFSGILPIEEAAEEAPGKGKRLRAQQRALLALQQEVDAKKKEFEQVSQQHHFLQQRLKVLEAVLPVREQQIAYLERQQQERTISGRRGSAQQFELQEVSSGVSSSGLLSVQPEASRELSALGLEETPDIASPSCGEHQDEQMVLAPPPHSAALALANWRHDSALLARLQPTDSQSLDTPEEVIQEFMKAWQRWIGVASLQLHAHDARPDDVGPQLRINKEHDQLLTFVRGARICHPNIFNSIIGRSAETGERVDPPPESYWLSVARGLRLSDTQVADIRAALHLYQERMDRVLAERRVISGQLSGVLSQLVQRGVGNAYQVERMQLLVRAEELQQQLSRNVAMEEQAAGIVKDFLGSGLLTQVQAARACVLAHPYFLDAVAILHAVDQLAP